MQTLDDVYFTDLVFISQFKKHVKSLEEECTAIILPYDLGTFNLVNFWKNNYQRLLPELIKALPHYDITQFTIDNVVVPPYHYVINRKLNIVEKK